MEKIAKFLISKKNKPGLLLLKMLVYQLNQEMTLTSIQEIDTILLSLLDTNGSIFQKTLAKVKENNKFKI